MMLLVLVLKEILESFSLAGCVRIRSLDSVALYSYWMSAGEIVKHDLGDSRAEGSDFDACELVDHFSFHTHSSLMGCRRDGKRAIDIVYNSLTNFSNFY